MTYAATRRANYLSYIVQGIINNLSPLFFIIFQEEFGFSYGRLGALVVINFVTQITVDALSVKFVEKLGYRIPIVMAQACAALGLILLGALPSRTQSAYGGLVAATVISAVGGGLLEVLVSPIMDSLPTPQNQKASAMSFLHSFYSWGQAGVVLITTLLLQLFGGGKWWILPMFWSALPLFNLFLFLFVPLPEPVPEETRASVKDLFLSPVFLAIILLMIASGASELTVSQWASLFVEQNLGLSKVWGDIAGPCVFALLMGCGRVLYSALGGKIPHRTYMIASAFLCVLCYILLALPHYPVLSLAGCALSGLAVSVMWPGMLSYASARFPLGGTLMFGVLAMAGDMGCSAGPWIAGAVADRSGSLSAGILSAAVFPALMILLLLIMNAGRGKGA